MKKLALLSFLIVLLAFIPSKDDKPVIGLNIGNVAPEITGPTPNGDTLSLSALRGNYVLVDFWASWCRPCRFENRNLIKTVEHFKYVPFPAGKTWTGKIKTTNGFQVFSVSLDRTKDAWKRAIKQDKLDWPWHVSELKYWDTKYVNLYNIQGIPTNYLLDPNGVIVGKNLRGRDLDNALERLSYKPSTDKK